MRREREIVEWFEKDSGKFVMDRNRKTAAMDMLQKKIEEKNMVSKAPFWEILRMQITFMNKRVIILQLLTLFVLIWVYVRGGRTFVTKDLYLTGTVVSALFSVFLVISCFEEEQFGIAELAGSCYFNNRQLCLLRMILSGGINLLTLSLMIVYMENLTRDSLLQVGLYVLVPYLMAGCIHFLVMLAGIARSRVTSVGVSAVIVLLCGSGGTMFPQLYEDTAAWLWFAGLIIFGGIYAAEIAGILKQMDRGTRLCMS